MLVCHCDRCDEPDPHCEHGVSTYDTDCVKCEGETLSMGNEKVCKVCSKSFAVRATKLHDKSRPSRGSFCRSPCRAKRQPFSGASVYTKA